MAYLDYSYRECAYNRPNNLAHIRQSQPRRIRIRSSVVPRTDTISMPSLQVNSLQPEQHMIFQCHTGVQNNKLKNGICTKRSNRGLP